jgi:TonB family protein
MNFYRHMNTQFNLFHAVAWSIGFHIFVVGFSPSLKNEPSITLEKPNEKIRLKIAKKPEPKTLKTVPVAMSPVAAIPRKLLVEPKVSLIPVKVNLNQQTNPSPIKTLPKIPRNIKNVRPVISHIPNLIHSPVRTAHIVPSYSKPMIQDVGIYKSQIKNTSTISRKLLNVHSNQNKSNFMRTNFHPKPMTKSPDDRSSQSIGVFRKINQINYYDNSFTPELRNVHKVKFAKKIIEIDFEKLWSEYSYLIRMKVASAKIYPESAREKNQQGKATLSLKLGKDGSVLKVSIWDSSGHKVLDQAAVAAIKDAAPYPQIPDKLNKKYVLLKLPISFILN